MVAKRVLNFSVVGAINTILNVAVFNVLLIFTGLGAGIANLISIIISIFIAFILSNKYVFHDRRDPVQTQRRFVKFVFVNILSLLVIHQVVLLLFLHIFLLPGEIIYGIISALFGDIFSQDFVKANVAKLLAVLASMAVSYILYDRFVFRKHSK